MRKDEIDKASDEITEKLKQRIKDSERMTIVMAPPGSGKTHLLVEVLAEATTQNLRVAVATPTNAQANEVCERLKDRFPAVPVVRYVSSNFTPEPGHTYTCTSNKDAVSALTSGVVVGTVAKWGFVDFRDEQPFDYLVIEESWQVKLSDFMPLLPISGKFILIGDPGQIDPVVSIDASRWATSQVGPHKAAPDAVIATEIDDLETLRLPATRRLPLDSADLISNFYDFDFEAYAGPNERKLEFTKKIQDQNFRQLWQHCEGSTTIGLTLDPIKLDGPPPLEGDRLIAELTAKTIAALLEMKPVAHVSQGESLELLPQHIGIAATRRVLVQDLIQSLPSNLREQIRVDTPERWQGLQRPVMFAVHPLSSVIRPSSFDLETGRLCVMASRHKTQLFVVSRGHIDEMLAEYDPPGDQALGGMDNSGRGHSSHEQFISELKKKGMWLKAA